MSRPPHPTALQDSPILEPTRADVVTGSRVHFGLLANICKGAPSFGGCGLMVHRPSVHVRAQRSGQFTARGLLADRCLKVAQQFTDHLGLQDLPGCELQVLKSPDSHSGLGSGTQIDLAVAHALAAMHPQASIPCDDITLRIAKRGRRSAVGTHGFARGGFIVETGIAQPNSLGTLHEARAFPKEWRVLLVTPAIADNKVHGQSEETCFEELPHTSPATRQSLWSILHNALLPAVLAHDYEAFSHAVEEYNFQSGMLFESTQGGAYNGVQLTELVSQLKECGCNAIGQSSWGPTVFAICRSQQSAEELMRRLRQQTHSSVQMQITRARNKPATICTKVS